VIAKEKYVNGLLLLVLAVTFAVFSPVLRNGFLTYDDPQWTTQDPLIASFDGAHVKACFTTPVLNMYAPVVLVSFAAEAKFFGMHAGVFHLFNLLFHLLNVGLVYVLMRKLLHRPLPALLAALLFALHPMAVDTVAWISARSNLLSTSYLLAAFLAYLACAERRNLLLYFLSLVLFVLAALCKSSVIAFPFVLLLADHLSGRRRNARMWLEKIPFFAIAAAAGIAALHFRADANAAHTAATYTLAEKIFLLCYSWDAYLVRLLLPVRISALYTAPEHLRLIHYLSPALPILLGILTWKAKQFQRELLFGAGFFMLGSAPAVWGFFEDGFTANRYAYLPGIGIFYLVACTLTWFPGWKHIILITVGTFILCCAILALDRAPVWENDNTLMTDVILKEPDNAFAWNSRGVWNYYQGDHEQAFSDYSSAITWNPRYAEAYYNRGIVCHADHRFEDALADYTKALELNPASANTYLARGITYMDGLNRPDSAMADLDRALGIDINFAQAYYNRALVKIRMGKDPCDDLANVRALGYTQGDELMERYCK
jgi:tetratricopeptide (TPR) repeat protein